MEEAFNEFIKDNWPGLVKVTSDTEFAKVKNDLKEAFEAGWEKALEGVDYQE